MWIFKYLVCLVRKHIFASIILQDLPYHYCLRCGKVQVQAQDVVTEGILVGGGRKPSPFKMQTIKPKRLNLRRK